MDRAEIHRWNGHHWLALAGFCVVQATFITSPATAAQNQEPEEIVTGSRIRQNPVESTAPVQTAVPGRFFHARAALKF
jgi:iron complex outermembrane recepter protein